MVHRHSKIVYLTALLITNTWALALPQAAPGAPPTVSFTRSDDPRCIAVPALSNSLPSESTYSAARDVFSLQDGIDTENSLHGFDGSQRLPTGVRVPYKPVDASTLEAELLLQCSLWDPCCAGDDGARRTALDRWFKPHSAAEYLNGKRKEGTNDCPWGKDYCTANLLYHYSVLKAWEQVDWYKNIVAKQSQDLKTLPVG